MTNSLITSESKVLHPKDFDPPLKRKEVAVPGYWTLDEIATELGITSRRVGYDITGYPAKKIKPNLKAYKAGRTLLVSDAHALAYIQSYRERKKS